MRRGFWASRSWQSRRADAGPSLTCRHDTHGGDLRAGRRFREHRRLGSRRDADHAVQLARDAFAVVDREADPKDWALCGQSLMTALAARAEHGGRHAVAHAREAEELLREVVPVLLGSLTLPERLELQADVSLVLRVAAMTLGDQALLAEAELTLMLARPDAEARGYARLVDLIDAEADRCDAARAALGITPVS